MRCLLTSLSRGAVTGEAVPNLLYVAHSQPTLDPRTRLAELASVCRLWAAALRDCGEETWQVRCVNTYFLPQQLPQQPWPWSGTLGPQVDDFVFYRHQERARVVERYEHDGSEASYCVLLVASGRTRETEAQYLSPVAPWRRLFLALTQHIRQELEEPPAVGAAGIVLGLQFGTLIVPPNFTVTTHYSRAQLAAWDTALDAQRDSHVTALLAALRRNETRSVCAELFRLRCLWSQANDLALLRAENARRAQQESEARAHSAQRESEDRAYRSAAALEQERCLEAVAAVVAELTELQLAGQTVELDMRDAFVNGIRRGSRVAEWSADLSRMTTELASLQFRLDAMAAVQSNGDDSYVAVTEARKAANGQVDLYLEGLSRWIATCNALQRLFEDLLLLPRPPSASVR